MENLIKALQIFMKYSNRKYPTHCEHDILFIVGYTKEEISENDREELASLGFEWSDEYSTYISFKYGSA